jgi:tellurite resistance protein TerC
VLALLALDLGVFHRAAHTVKAREAAIWSVVWVALSLTFNAGIYFYWGRQAALEFLTGYLIEKALSVDNIFVFLLVFSYFQVPAKYQHRVLFWGVLSALVMRGAMIAAGSYLIARFEWILYIFGVFLVVTAVRMATQDDRAIEPEANPVIRLVRSLIPVTNVYHGQRFFVRDKSRWVATPLFIVLVFIEVTDLVFAVDSIPAVFAVTKDTFLIYTSNVFAILGLRSLYFLLADVVGRFHFLKLGLAAVLGFVGLKMLAADVFHLPVGISLGVIALLLGSSVVASWMFPKETEAHSPVSHPGREPGGVNETPPVKKVD